MLLSIGQKSKTLAAGITLLSCSACFASLPPDFLHPPQTGYSFIEGQGAFLKQSDDGADYALKDIGDVPNPASPSPQGSLKGINPSYRFAGGATIGYLFPDLSDLRVSFFRSASSDTSSIEAGDVYHLDPILLHVVIIGGTSFWANEASSRYRYSAEAFDLLLGHWLRLTRKIALHPSVGINLSEIKVKQTTDYFDLNVNGNPGLNGRVIERSYALGVGPVVGTDLSYRLFEQISLEGNVALALLLGHINSSYDSQRDVPEAPPDTTDVSNKIHSLLIERISTQLGLAYHIAVSSAIAGHITLGYKFTEYVNATNYINPHHRLESLSSLNQLEGPWVFGTLFIVGVKHALNRH